MSFDKYLIILGGNSSVGMSGICSCFLQGKLSIPKGIFPRRGHSLHREFSNLCWGVGVFYDFWISQGTSVLLQRNPTYSGFCKEQNFVLSTGGSVLPLPITNQSIGTLRRRCYLGGVILLTAYKDKGNDKKYKYSHELVVCTFPLGSRGIASG